MKTFAQHLVSEESGPRMTTQERNKAKTVANSKLDKMFKTYQDGLPIQAVIDLLHSVGFTETDGLVGIYCGRDGNVHECVGNNVWLSFTWHKMEGTGRYEVVAYVS